MNKAKKTRPIEVVIDRSKWRCGGDDAKTRQGEGETRLLNAKGFMCCLGFVSHACGATKRDLRGQGMPDEVADHRPKSGAKLVRAGLVLEETRDGWNGVPFIWRDNVSLVKAAAFVNDDKTLGKRERERRVKETLAKIGFKVRFTGKYLPPKVKA